MTKQKTRLRLDLASGDEVYYFKADQRTGQVSVRRMNVLYRVSKFPAISDADTIYTFRDDSGRNELVINLAEIIKAKDTMSIVKCSDFAGDHMKVQAHAMKLSQRIIEVQKGKTYEMLVERNDKIAQLQAEIKQIGERRTALFNAIPSYQYVQD